MVDDYCLYDFIRLTGRFDTEIMFSRALYSRKVQLNHWLVLFKDKGYSIFDRSSKKIVEVNPNFITKWYWQYDKNVSIKPNIVFVRDDLVNFELHNLQDKDRLMIGDRRRTPKQKQQINYKYSTYNQPAENPARFKTYPEFKVDDLNKLKTEGINKPKEYGVRTSHLGLLYADYEVDHSWFFKVYKTRHIGENKYKLYLPNSKYEWKGICGYLSMTSLLLYAEYFVNSNYMGYSNASKYIKKN
ncbi:Uncharacterised protein [Metamycoplasma cloacale]|uniref:Uncharacterized protein n=1 Tax=Metamycoplasma cloacale TaxID=92401 RepID=A0A2Z4LNJ8_9BACT|nr:hypothetical protein [Metamycoplasma cloacale]AWX42928.1 hypothetical protein DK849_02565 [Metamycoplasma cloacale]VEU79248.1 Uncharacterised protein [Metamycoplasma cloacale]